MIQTNILYLLIVTGFCYHLNNISPGGLFKGVIQCSRIPLNGIIVTIYERESLTFVSNRTIENGYFELDVDKQLKNFLNGYIEFYYHCPGYNKIIYLEVNQVALIKNSNSYLKDKIYYFGILDPAEIDKIKDTVD
ncbi:Hypothetical protein SRAE_1000343600 [Strongyloides ratti]|uniref:Transthyretin-like family-containing protein n=1 Tax=Strongyloides ratti TaxID=34506 RepID=A0A090LAQ6_STRRB|nr:Hypothetical protein SRAE_1000343600 [Strongyloides ratti]CEF65183.1 Hypothetical protein SRAE_1000343600 [Strongyloides ratti]